MQVLYIHLTEINQNAACHEAGIFVCFARKCFGFVFQVCQMHTDGGLHGFIQREAFQQGITDFSIGFFCRIIQAFDAFGGFSQISGGIGGFAGYVGVGILEQGKQRCGTGFQFSFGSELCQTDGCPIAHFGILAGQCFLKYGSIVCMGCTCQFYEVVQLIQGVFFFAYFIIQYHILARSRYEETQVFGGADMVGKGCTHLYQHFCVFGRVGQVVQFTGVFFKVEQHFGRMGIERLRPVGVVLCPPKTSLSHALLDGMPHW